MGTRDDGLYVAAEGRASRVPRTFADNKLNALLADYSGNFWVGTDHGMFLLTLAGEITDPLPSWTHQHQILTLFMDRVRLGRDR